MARSSATKGSRRSPGCQMRRQPNLATSPRIANSPRHLEYSRRRPLHGVSALPRDLRGADALVEVDAAVSKQIDVLGELLVMRGSEVDVGDRHRGARTRRGDDPPLGIDDRAALRPRLATLPPARSQHAIATLLVLAVDMAVMTSPGRSPSGRGNSGQFTGAVISSARSSATRRVSSPNSRS